MEDSKTSNDNLNNLHPLKVLIVEDSRVEYQSLMITLESEKIAFEHYWAKDGGEALAILENHKVDLIFCDLLMPHIDGFEFIRQSNERNLLDGATLVILTSSASTMDKKTCDEAGADDFLTKPLDPKEFYKLRRRLGLWMIAASLTKNET